MTDDIYEIYAIKYARLMRRSPENFIGGDPHDTEMPLNYYVWVIADNYGTVTNQSSTSNDLQHSAAFTVAASSDLVPQSITVTPTTVAPGAMPTRSMRKPDNAAPAG